ncbi:hypothetical protein ACFU8W_47940 [Streptomyces sp. NPDC057565]|uniref:hypothetical protein n=1 Tax=Streptomyces sp. NPDC057565 TaxID=3346169 RepID=UPI0036AA78DA
MSGAPHLRIPSDQADVRPQHSGPATIHTPRPTTSAMAAGIHSGSASTPYATMLNSTPATHATTTSALNTVIAAASAIGRFTAASSRLLSRVTAIT